MKQLKPQQRVIIHSYKHDGSLHRVWKNSVVIKNTDDTLIVYNNKTKVIESSGRVWYSKEPAVVYFFKDQWFNIISMVREDGIYYYCNLSSPYLYDGEAVKYIDYDLDVKVYPNFSYKILDRNEYKYHAKLMDYSKEIKNIIEIEVKTLTAWIKNRNIPFNHEEVLKQSNKMISTIKQKNKKNKKVG